MWTFVASIGAAQSIMFRDFWIRICSARIKKMILFKNASTNFILFYYLVAGFPEGILFNCCIISGLLPVREWFGVKFWFWKDNSDIRYSWNQHDNASNEGNSTEKEVSTRILTFLSATNFNGNICVTPPPVPFELPGDVIVFIIGGFSIFVLENVR